MTHVSGLRWVKSSYSDEGGNNCVEVAAVENAVAVRDSKKPAQVLEFSPNAFASLIRNVKAGPPGPRPS
ncbi:DUF397 domain-containing protein [Streptomyces sp. NPDC001351]|uniref:DUF397 domain-containing protein n=1 Tax=Streptomyces sp. NPDC001351 TaxID=3364564 RepID=UPI00368F014E